MFLNESAEFWNEVGDYEESEEEGKKKDEKEDEEEAQVPNNTF